MTYTVRRGDTLSQIADRFNVSVRELLTWNKLRQAIFTARRSATGTLRRFEPAERRLTIVGFLAGKRALIVGLATERSIAHGIATAMHREGAELAFTYQGERLKERVIEMAQGFGSALTVPMDVASDAEIDAAFAQVRTVWDSLDIIVHSVAFAPREELAGSFVDSTTRQGFQIAHDISSYSLTALAKAGRPLMQGRNGALVTLSYLGAVRSIPSYNVMGLAKASLEANVRFLAADLGPENIRVNAISAGPIKTLAAAGIGGFPQDAGSRRRGESVATQRHHRRSRQRRRVPCAPTWPRASPAKCCTSTPATATSAWLSRNNRGHPPSA
jgi:enoyl-[acyl-carrier protein] reductase I